MAFFSSLLAFFDRAVEIGRRTRPETLWLMVGDETPWQELTTVAAFIKNYC